MRAFEIPDEHQYHENFHGAVPEPKTFYVINTHLPFSFTDSTNRCKGLHVILNRAGVENFIELSLKEQWIYHCVHIVSD